MIKTGRKKGDIFLKQDEINELKEFGKKLKEIRISKNLSQEKLANLAGLHRTYIWMLESGKVNPTLTTVNRIAKALGVHNEFLK